MSRSKKTLEERAAEARAAVQRRRRELRQLNRKLAADREQARLVRLAALGAAVEATYGITTAEAWEAWVRMYGGVLRDGHRPRPELHDGVPSHDE